MQETDGGIDTDATAWPKSTTLTASTPLRRFVPTLVSCWTVPVLCMEKYSTAELASGGHELVRVVSMLG